MKKTIIIPLLLVFSCNLQAQTKKVNCSKAITQYEMNICEEQKFLKADKELNALYKKLVSVINEKGLEDVKTQLVDSQKKWIELRDSHSKIFEIYYQGGSSMAMNALSSKTLLTLHRTQELKAVYIQVSL